VHRDVCPANIFLSYPLDNEGNPDFNTIGTYVETLRAPEQTSQIIRVRNGADVNTPQVMSRLSMVSHRWAHPRNLAGDH
jgi:hypothetical protein